MLYILYIQFFEFPKMYLLYYIIYLAGRYQSPRFKSFCLSLKSLNADLRPNLRPNFDDILCHVIDSCEILGLKFESLSRK